MTKIDVANVLLVDDKPENLFALERILEDLDCRLFKATSGQEALRLVKDYDFALVLLDVQMPDMDGFETAVLMRGTSRARHIPIIFVTAINCEQQYVFQGYETGAVDYLFKPIEPGILRSKAKVFIELCQKNALLKQRAKDLENEVNRREQIEKQLRRAVEAANAANRAKSKFLSNMSHELRTPLNAIIGFAQIMRHRPHLKVEELEELSIISRSGEHLLTLINDVLDFSKIEAGHTTLNKKNIDLHCLLDDVINIFRLKAKKKQLQLMFEYASKFPQYVRTDAVKLRQVLINLLNNAIKFTEEGGVSVRVKGERLKVNGEGLRVNGEKQEEKTFYPPPLTFHLLFEIEDTGPGIAPEEIAKLFDAFVQTESGRQAQEGTGLGLTISKKFVQLMGGDITVKSEVGRGTTFKFDIQCEVADSIDNHQSTIINRVVALEPGQPRYRILIVDDKPDNRKVLLKYLNPLGFELREAQNGQDAVNIWQEWQPHLIWMDLRMPECDGYEATKRIRNEELRIKNGAAPPKHQTPNTRIIVLNASSYEEERSVALSKGCDDFLRKPFRAAEIFDLLHKHLGVRFVYEENGGQQVKGQRSKIKGDARKADEILTPAALAALSKELVLEFQQAVEALDVDTTNSIIDQIRLQNFPLADVLAELVTQYRFDTLQALFAGRE